MSMGVGPVGAATIKLSGGEMVLTATAAGVLEVPNTVRVAGLDPVPDALLGAFYDVTGARQRLDPIDSGSGLLTLTPDPTRLLQQPLDLINDDDGFFGGIKDPVTFHFPDPAGLFNYEHATLRPGLSWVPVFDETEGLFLTVVPEPGTLALLISGGLGLLLLVWRRRS